MRKSILRVALLAIAMATTTSADAQLSNVLKNAAGALTGSKDGGTVSTAINAVTNLLGKKSVTEKDLIGTWNYSEPCIALESKNVLSKVGGSVASSKAESMLADKLKLIGFTKGKVVMTLNEGGEGSIKVNNKTQNINWAVNGSNLAITFPMTKKTVNMNTNMTGGKLQVAMDSTKMLTLLNTISDKASAVNSNLSAVSSLLKNVDGMYLGLKFTK